MPSLFLIIYKGLHHSFVICLQRCALHFCDWFTKIRTIHLRLVYKGVHHPFVIGLQICAPFVFSGLQKCLFLVICKQRCTPPHCDWFTKVYSISSLFAYKGVDHHSVICFQSCEPSIVICIQRPF